MAKKIGYVLSGGGSRAFAHLGILKYFEEISIYPYAISGTSAGCIAGALYAAGKKPDEILELMKHNSYFGWSNIAWRKEGIFTMDKLYKLLQEIIGENDFSSLRIKFFATCTDLNKGTVVTLSEGKLFEAIVASCSIPVIFNPVVSGDRLLADGGILNNLPVEPLIDICDVIIGSYVNKLEPGLGNISTFRAVNIMDRSFHLAISGSVYSKTNQCDVFIECPLHAYSIYDVKAADEIFEIGYKTAREYKDKIERIMEYQLP